MAKIQAVWAIDIGQSALKAIKLVPGETPEQVVAEAFDFIEYPKILSQPDADPDELVREALATFTDRNEVKGCKVAIAVPGQSGLVKFIKLPPVEKKRIPDIVKFEAKQQIPFALDEVVWAYQQIGGDEEANEEEFTMAEVGLFAMKRDQINRAILPFAVAGIEVDIVQMSPIALYNFITFDQLKGSGSKESVVLLDIGADNTDLIITDGTRIWQRNVPIGGNHFTRALDQRAQAHVRQGRAPEAQCDQGRRSAVDLHGDARGVQRFRQRDQPLDRLLFEHQPDGQDPQDRRAGQRLQAAGLAEVSAAKPQPRGRPARGFRQDGGRRGQVGPAVSGQSGLVRRGVRAGGSGPQSGRAGHEPAAAGDRAGPAGPCQEAVGAGGVGLDHAGPHAAVRAGRFPRARARSRRLSSSRPSTRPIPCPRRGAALKAAFDKAKGEWEGEVCRGQGA